MIGKTWNYLPKWKTVLKTEFGASRLSMLLTKFSLSLSASAKIYVSSWVLCWAEACDLFPVAVRSETRLFVWGGQIFRFITHCNSDLKAKPLLPCSWLYLHRSWCLSESHQQRGSHSWELGAALPTPVQTLSTLLLAYTGRGPCLFRSQMWYDEAVLSCHRTTVRRAFSVKIIPE